MFILFFSSSFSRSFESVDISLLCIWINTIRAANQPNQSVSAAVTIGGWRYNFMLFLMFSTRLALTHIGFSFPFLFRWLLRSARLMFAMKTNRRCGLFFTNSIHQQQLCECSFHTDRLASVYHRF